MFHIGKRHNNHFLLGALIGGSLGAVSSFLFNSKKGQLVKKQLAAKYNEMSKIAQDYVKKSAVKAKTTARKTAGKAKAVRKKVKRKLK
ncbi:MAG: YtxH domain-containing protein [Chlamydiales bacterium]